VSVTRDIAKRGKESAVAACDVIDALKAGPFPIEAHAWIAEVRSGTGYARATRYADALVVSCWPSRGIWIAGIEVKVHRGDWLRELRDPEKSAELQQWCDYWWLAAPVGVVEAIEVPETWGLLEVDKKRVKRAKEAPRQERQPWEVNFVASLLRNVAAREARLCKAAREAGERIATERYSGENFEETLLEQQRRADRAEEASRYAKNDLACLRAAVAEFETAAGVSLAGLGRNVGAQYRAASLLAAHDTEKLAARFDDVAKALRAAVKT